MSEGVPSYKPYIIGISGGSASGKTSVTKEIFDKMGIEDCLMITMDSYYRVISTEERKDLSNFNFDHPSAFDFELILSQLRDLLNGKPAEIPIYNFTTSSRETKTDTKQPTYLIIFEGIFALTDERIRNMMDMRIFVDTDDDVRLARRIYRDVRERGRNLTGIIERYNKFVKPSYEEYIRPQRRYADVIVPKGSENKIAIDLVCTNLKSQLEKRTSFRLNSTKKFEFVKHDIFDNRAYSSDVVSIINDENKQENLKIILEDCLNLARPQYHKIFATELVQSLIEHYISEQDEEKLFSCYILDELNEVNDSILKDSNNIIFFRMSLITESDIEVIKEKLKHAFKYHPNISMMTIFLNPFIVELLLKEFPKLKFITVFISTLFDSKIKNKLEEYRKNEDYSYNKEYLGGESMCQLFRKQMFLYNDDD